MSDVSTLRIPLDLLDTNDDDALQAFVDGFDPTGVEGLSETSRHALANGQAPLVKQFALQEAASRILEKQRQQAVESHPALIDALERAAAMRVPLDIPATLEQLRAVEAGLAQFGQLVGRSEANLATEALRRELFDEPIVDVRYLADRLKREKQRLCYSPLPIDASNKMRSQLETVLQGIQLQLAAAEDFAPALERRRQESLAAHGRIIQSTVTGEAMMLMMSAVTSDTPFRERDLLSSALDDLDQILLTEQKFADIDSRLTELREQYPMSHRRLRGQFGHLINDPLDSQIEYLLSNRIARTRRAAIDRIYGLLDDLEPQLQEMDQRVADAILKVQPVLDEAITAHQEITRLHSSRVEAELAGHTKRTLEVGPRAMFDEMVANGKDPEYAAGLVHEMMLSKLTGYRERSEREISSVTRPSTTGSTDRKKRDSKRRERSEHDRQETARRKGHNPQPPNSHGRK